MKILVTGGAGYIGSHTVIALLQAKHDVVVVDNYVNSCAAALFRVKKITGVDFNSYEVDLLNYDALENVFKKEKIDAVIHFAGLKAVGESVAHPLRYYNNNLTGTLNLLSLMEKYKVNNFVFSSSATVYGDPKTVPIAEDFPLSTTNPYGTTKLFIEQILRDWCKANSSLNVVLLRYFNPVGAHSSGLIGEDPNGIPNNLVPYVLKVAIGTLPNVNVFGDDYPTPDGTGVRDYIHVCDLANGHVAALQKIQENCGCETYNLGTGRGYSVLEIIKTIEEVSGKTIPYKIVGRRAGDIATCYADSTKAFKELGWKAEKTLKEMCADSWNWQQKNPHGYQE